MSYPELEQFITIQLDKGASVEQIRTALVSAGWQAADIDAVLARKANQGMPQQSAPAVGPKQPLQAGHAVEPDGTLSDSSNSHSPLKIVDGLTTRGKIITFSIIAIVLASIIGGAVYAYVSLYNSSDRSTQNVVNGLLNLYAVSYTIEINGSQSRDNSIELAGTVDISDKSNLKTQGAFSLSAVTESSVDRFLAGEYRMINSNGYLKLTDIAIPEFAPLKNTWAQLPKDDFASIVELGFPKLGSLFESGSAFTWNEETQNGILAAFQAHPFIEIQDLITTEERDGIVVSQYVFLINKESVVAFLNESKPVLVKMGLSAEEVEDWINSATYMGRVTGNIWVSPTDYMVYELNIRLSDITIDAKLRNHNNPITIVAPLNPIIVEDLTGDNETTETADENTIAAPPIDTEVGNNTNSDVTTNTPSTANTTQAEDSINEEVDNVPVAGIPTSDFDVEESNIPAAPIDSDGDGLSDEEEQEYNTNPNAVDSDLDGYTDKEEIENGYNPLGPGKLE